MKKNICIFILSALIFSSITAYATTTYYANQIKYIKSNNQEVTLDSALNELYSTSSGLTDALSEATSNYSSCSSSLSTCQSDKSNLQTEINNYKTLSFKLYNEAFSNTRVSRAFLRMEDYSSKYKYVSLSNPSYETGTNFAAPTDLTLSGWNESTNQTITFTAGQKYLTAEITSIILDSKSSVDSKKARSYVTVTLSN